MKSIPNAIARELIEQEVLDLRGSDDAKRICFVEDYQDLPSPESENVEIVVGIKTVGGFNPIRGTDQYKPMIRFDIRESFAAETETAYDVYDDIYEALNLHSVADANQYRDIGGLNLGWLEINQEIFQFPDSGYQGKAKTYTFTINVMAHRSDLR